jgi:flagellar hook-associated protein 1 FlgK
MFGLFAALELGKRSLLAQQYALTTSGHNIANVNTPGYSRQRVEMQSTAPLDMVFGKVGTGVMVTNVVQVRDYFLTAQYRNEASNLQRWDTTSKTLSQVEGLLNEPGDTGMNQLLTDFWNAWEDLSTNPSARSAVVEKGKVLVNAFHQYASQIADLKQNLDDDIGNRVSEVNQLASQISELNRQIITSEMGVQKANDLRDRRDQLIDQLASLATVRTIERDNGGVAVLLGSMALVDGADHLSISTEEVATANDSATVAFWKNTTFQIDFSGGELAALQELRDTLVPEFEQGLDQMAQALVTAVNAIHRTGYTADGSTGVDFFNQYQTTAATIGMNPDVANDPSLLAASQSGEPGDARIAQAISELRSSKVMVSGSQTLNSFYANMVGTLGIRSQEASNMKDNYELLVTQIDNQRQSIQGVSTDEEMTQMVKFQRAYEAAARVVTYADSALETIITGMGITR